MLNSLTQIDEWTGFEPEAGAALPALLQVDSGMARLGLSPAEVDRLVQDPARLDGIELRAVMSHLACADEPDHPANRAQLAMFEAQRRRLPPAPASFANSSGIFLGADYHFDLARPGAALYGVAPVPGMPQSDARGRAARRAGHSDAPDRGRRCGRYGYAFTAGSPARIATLSVGYADGWLRSVGAPASPMSATRPCRSPVACRWIR